MSSMPPSPSFSFSTSPAIWLEPERATAFVAVARVTEDRWVACKVLDSIDFGLEEGGELVFEPRSAMRYGPRTMRRDRRRRQQSVLRPPHAAPIRLPKLYLRSDHS